MSNNKRHIFLVGPSGVGKSSVARAVSEKSDLSLLDLDDALVEHMGMGITEYFEKYGEAAFREQERDVIRMLESVSEPHVVATGGGTVLDSRNIVSMRNNGYVVYLNAFEADLVDRINGDESKHRPLLQTDGDLGENVRQLFLARRECYELAAEVTIATSRRDVATVADAVLRQCARLSGQDIDSPSTIVVGEQILSSCADHIAHYSSVVLLTQESIPSLYREKVELSLREAGTEVLAITVVEGEAAKTFESYASVIEQMSAARITRSACVIGIGGGVVGDLAGFVASTYHRGIDVIHIPTTLLAQVDSSIGGKCGINLSTGKNLVGAFHQPKNIVVDTTTLATLPDEDFQSGLGEVVKYALLGNLTVVEAIESNSEEVIARDPSVLIPVIRSCMNHKVHVVARDPFERNGIRATLNLGHTLAHAIEKTTNFSLAHGKAVALGLRFAAELSLALGRIPQSERDRAIGLIDALKLQSEIPESCRDASALVDLMYADKKSEGDLSFVLFNVGGGAELVHDVDRDAVESALHAFLS